MNKNQWSLISKFSPSFLWTKPTNNSIFSIPVESTDEPDPAVRSLSPSPFLSPVAMHYRPTMLPVLTHNFASTYPQFCQNPPTMLPILTQKFAKSHPQYQHTHTSLPRSTQKFAKPHPQFYPPKVTNTHTHTSLPRSTQMFAKTHPHLCQHLPTMLKFCSSRSRWALSQDWASLWFLFLPWRKFRK